MRGELPPGIHGGWLLAHIGPVLLGCVAALFLLVWLGILLDGWEGRPISRKELRRLTGAKRQIAQTYLTQRNELLTRKKLNELYYDYRQSERANRKLEEQRRAYHSSEDWTRPR